MSDPFGDFADLDRFSNDCVPESSTRLPGPDAFPDGAYSFEVVSAELTKTPKSQETIFRLLLRVLTGPHAGIVLERPTFFGQPERLNYLLGDFVTLGFTDAAQWGKRGRPISADIIAACPKLAGVKFAGKIEKWKQGQGASLYVNARISGAPMPGATPAVNGPARPVQPTTTAPSQRERDDIPF